MPLNLRISTQEKDLGKDEFLKQVKAMKDKPYIKVGILADTPPEEDGTPMVVVAASNEFGTSDGRVPERSFIRSTMSEKKGEFSALTRRMLLEIILGADIRKSFGLIGTAITRAIKKKITDIKTPPNAPSTIKRKGSSNPLIDTGRLRASINHKVVLVGDEE